MSLTFVSQFLYSAAQVLKTPSNSGRTAPSARFSCVHTFDFGRECDGYNTRKGKKSACLFAGFELPPASIKTRFQKSQTGARHECRNVDRTGAVRNLSGLENHSKEGARQCRFFLRPGNGYQLFPIQVRLAATGRVPCCIPRRTAYVVGSGATCYRFHSVLRSIHKAYSAKGNEIGCGSGDTWSQPSIGQHEGIRGGLGNHAGHNISVGSVGCEGIGPCDLLAKRRGKSGLEGVAVNPGALDQIVLANTEKLLPRLLSKQQVNATGCWDWIGATNGKSNPYGRLNIAALADRRVALVRAHRVSWLLLRGPIAAGLHVLHKCDNTLCINPDHLFLGTHLDNMADREQKGRNRPIRGSEWQAAHAGTVRRREDQYFVKFPEMVARGSQVPWAKLDEAKVLEIRRRLGGVVMGRLVFELAEEYGVSHHTIRLIAKRKVWKHV